MQVTNNHILIRPDESYESLGRLELKTFVSSHNHARNTGVVVAAPDCIQYIGDQLGFDAGFSDIEQDRYREMNEMAIASQDVKVPLEIKAGDRVMFRHIHLLVDEENNDFVDIDGEKLLLIPYSSLIARVDESLYPLNGYVFVECPGVEDYLRGRVKSLSKGVVRFTGCQGEHYRYYPDYKDSDIPVGSEVAFLFNQAIGIENSLHVNTGSEFPLIRIHRPEILAVKF